jgi:hypothetical protein
MKEDKTLRSDQKIFDNKPVFVKLVNTVEQKVTILPALNMVYMNNGY